MTASLWITDFALRVKQLDKIVSLASSSAGIGSLKSSTFWLGGLFTPEAFITATRQCVAQANSWSLEDLKLDMHIGDDEGEPMSMDDFSFGIDGLKMHGAASKQNR
jgi:dynein heavy chain 1